MVNIQKLVTDRLASKTKVVLASSPGYGKSISVYEKIEVEGMGQSISDGWGDFFYCTKPIVFE